MRLLSFLAALPLAIGPTLAAVKVRADNRVLNTDLAFHFVCKDKDRSSLEEAMETFLRNEHFRVLNKGRNQREHGVFLLDLDVVGIDDGQNIIEFDALPRTDGRYSAGLNTPPPTRRNPQLEKALLKFVSEALGCDVRQIQLRGNDADARELHGRKVQAIENWFREVEQLRREQRR